MTIAENITDFSAITPTGRPSQRGEWTWELAYQYPRQGDWTEEQYSAREFEGIVEFVDGKLEFHAMVSRRHQDIWELLFDLLRDYVRPRRLGKVYSAPMRVRVRPGLQREPDVSLAGHDQLGPVSGPLDGALLVMEVVSDSEDDRERDFVEKRADYAQANIPEYWIVDPETETITVLTLPANQTEYAVHGEFQSGQRATSKLLDGFTVDVTACFEAGKQA